MFAQITDIPKMAGQLSGQSDRFLFIAAILVIVIGGVGVIRYLVKQNEKAGKVLESIAVAQNETTGRLAVIIDRNTCALEENTTTIQRSNDLREQQLRKL